MFELVNHCGTQFSNYFLIQSKHTEVQILDMKDVLARFANDVIATCVAHLALKLPHKKTVTMNSIKWAKIL